MKRVCIFGGTFNPPHIGHLIMANEVYHALKFDEVRFMPNAKPPHKETNELCTEKQRLELVRLAIEPFPYFSLEAIELSLGGTSYSFDTMTELQKREPNTTFSFLIGSDMIEYLPKWYRIDELVEFVNMVGVKRPGYESESKYPVTLIEAPQIDLSSTMLRKRLANKKDVSMLIPNEVQMYIRQEHLYE